MKTALVSGSWAEPVTGGWCGIWGREQQLCIPSRARAGLGSGGSHCPLRLALRTHLQKRSAWGKQHRDSPHLRYNDWGGLRDALGADGSGGGAAGRAEMRAWGGEWGRGGDFRTPPPRAHRACRPRARRICSACRAAPGCRSSSSPRSRALHLRPPGTGLDSSFARPHAALQFLAKGPCRNFRHSVQGLGGAGA